VWHPSKSTPIQRSPQPPVSKSVLVQLDTNQGEAP
jgi:hypothetical protein